MDHQVHFWIFAPDKIRPCPLLFGKGFDNQRVDTQEGWDQAHKPIKIDIRRTRHNNGIANVSDQFLQGFGVETFWPLRWIIVSDQCDIGAIFEKCVMKRFGIMLCKQNPYMILLYRIQHDLYGHVLMDTRDCFINQFFAQEKSGHIT